MRGVSIEVLSEISLCKDLQTFAALWKQFELEGKVAPFEITNVLAMTPEDGSAGFMLVIKSGNIVPQEVTDGTG